MCGTVPLQPFPSPIETPQHTPVMRALPYMGTHRHDEDNPPRMNGHGWDPVLPPSCFVRGWHPVVLLQHTFQMLNPNKATSHLPQKDGDEGLFLTLKPDPFLPGQGHFIQRVTRWQSSSAALACFRGKKQQSKTKLAEQRENHVSICTHSPKHSWLELFLDPL